MHVQYMYMHVVTCVHVLQLFTCSVKNAKLSKSFRKLAWQGLFSSSQIWQLYSLMYDSTSTRACVLDMIRLSYTLLYDFEGAPVWLHTTVTFCKLPHVAIEPEKLFNSMLTVGVYIAVLLQA